MEDDAKRLWASEAVFVAGADGAVDLAQEVPVESPRASGAESPERSALAGTYRGVDAMGLLWSMALVPPEGDREGTSLRTAPTANAPRGPEVPQTAQGSDIYLKKELTPALVKLEAEIMGDAQPRVALPQAVATMVQHYVAPGTIVRALDPNDPGDRGLCGILFLPEDAPRPLPAVISLGGSGGGLSWETAGALAGHGYAALALPYFGFEPLPRSLNSIPLEYFEGAVDWLAARREIDPRRIAVHGQSRGGEVALLLAALKPEIRAVVGVVPGSVVWQGTGKAPDGRAAASSWTYRGTELPFVPFRMFPFKLVQAYRVLVRREPVEFEPLHRASLRNRAAVERAAIPVEQIRAPVLLISAGDDRVWPSTEMSCAIEERMAARGAAFPCRHIEYSRAGHMIRLPNMPATVRDSKHPGLGFRIAFGGEPPATARASAEAWREGLEYLDANLR